MTSRGRCLLLTFLLAGAGCKTSLEKRFDDPDTNPVRKVLKATMPLAYTANLTMAALTGEPPPNVRLLTSDDPRLNPFLLEITVDDAFPLPQGIDASGFIVVAGVMTRDSRGHPDFLLVTVLFGGLNLTRGTLALEDVTAMPVVVEHDLATGEDRLYAVYSDLDVDVGSSEAPLASLELTQQEIDHRYDRYRNMRRFDYERRATVEWDTWILTVSDHDTPGDASDDTYWVGGAQQYVDAGSSTDLMQLFLLMAMKPSCKANPVDGGGFLQNVDSGEGLLEGGQVALGVTGKCDGKMRFLAGTGSYVLLVDKPFALHLEQ